MRKYFIVIFSFCMFTSYSQHQLNGIIKDKADGSPVAYATAALMRTDSSVIKGVMVDNDGKFIIENIAAGHYLLQVSFIGYEKAYRRLNVPIESNLGDIFVSESVNRLNEVVVTAKRALVEQRLDRVVVNVSGNMITSGLNINDLLKQLPGLVVDENGNVKLNGRSATVYIDGRPTRLPAEQVAQMLTGMMGDVVDRVELIDNPSSRYEAGLSSAIVNIRIKRDASLGVNGTAQAGIGFTENDFAWRGGLNLNYRSKKVNIFGNYGHNNTPEYSNVYQRRNYKGETPLTYNQYSLMQNSSPSHSLRTGIDWFVSPKQTIGFLFSGSYNDSDGEIVANVDVTQTGVSKIDSIELSDSWITNKYSSQMYNLNYRLVGNKGEELMADIDYGRVYNRSWQDMQIRYQYPDGSERHPPSEFQYSGPRNIDILSLKVDYTKPFSEKSGIEAGIKTGQTVTDNEIRYENLYNGQWEIDNNQSNSFKYTEHVSAVYITYSQVFGKFSAMAGLRTEYTSTKGESPTMETSFTRSYFDWFPSSYLQYQIKEKQILNFSYSRKINRPGYSLLNPFRTYVDPFTYQSGNPDLKPSYRNTVALRYSIGEYSANLSYSAINDVFEQDYIQDDISHTTSLIQKNIGKRQGLTLGVSAPVRFAKWYSINIYSEATYAMVDSRHSGERFQKEYLSVYVGLRQTINILPSLKANIQVTWIKPPFSGILQFDNYWGMNAQMEKSFFDKRMSLTLSCNDVFSSLVYTGKINFANIDQSIRENPNLRQVMLTARYRFGSQKIRGARNHSIGIEEEMDRTK